MSSRDDLFQLILGRTTTKAVERILAAGYRKPREVTTTEELDALPIGSVVRSAREGIFEKANYHGDAEFPFWLVTGMNREFGNQAIPLPATVLHESAK